MLYVTTLTEMDVCVRAEAIMYRDGKTSARNHFSMHAFPRPASRPSIQAYFFR